jgi:hypothetical protein
MVEINSGGPNKTFGRPLEPEVNLARALLVQAVKDAQKDGKIGEEAREFLAGGEDLDFWRSVARI